MILDILKKVLTKYVKYALESYHCPSCGLTVKDLMLGRLGCAGCYKAFKDEIVEVLYVCQADLKHCGKKIRNRSQS